MRSRGGIGPGTSPGSAAGRGPHRLVHRKLVRTARYRTIQIQAGTRTISAADPLPDDLRQALDAIGHPG